MSFSHTDSDTLKDFIIDYCEDKEVIPQGNFNLPSIQWYKEDIMISSYVLPLNLDFSFRKLLDLVMCSHTEKV